MNLADVVGNSPVNYLIIAALVTLDAVLPIAPSETLVVTGGVLASKAELSVALVVLSAACGALAGHTVLYVLGRYAGPGLRKRLFKGAKGHEQLEQATQLLRRRTYLLIVSDFVPIGRTAAMFAAGALELPVRRFYLFVIPGAAIWATFYTLLGYIGGSAFESEWVALVVSISAALAIAGVAELVQWLRKRRARKKLANT